MTFKVGDRVLTEYDNKHGVLCEVISTEAGRYDYLVRPLADQPVDHLPMSVQRYEDELTEIHEPTAPAPFRKGDQVEHTDNAPGFIMTVAADQYTSGAVLVEWPDGSRHDHQARFLKHAEPMPTIQTPSIDPGSEWGMAEDVVSAPSHYRAHPSGIEVIDITRHESFLRGNVLKYVLRAPYKNNELEDLKKASQYLAWEIERLERS